MARTMATYRAKKARMRAGGHKRNRMIPARRSTGKKVVVTSK